MPIKRSSYQSLESIEDFYKRSDWTGASVTISKNMLEIVNTINELFIETELVASTSHQRLCIQDLDNKSLNWVVIISNVGLDEYYIEFKIPEYKSPWQNAWITGVAKNLDEAKQYLIIAMTESEAWIENKELKKLKKTLHNNR